LIYNISKYIEEVCDELFKDKKKAVCTDTDLNPAVASFLLSLKLTIQRDSSKNPTWTFTTGRAKNQQTLATLEMKVVEVKDVILSLTPLDYVRGPFKDRQIAGELWEFGKTVKGKEVYIKLKLISDSRSQNARVLSFHFPERPLHYRLRKKDKKEIRSHEDKLPGLRKLQRIKVKETRTGNNYTK